MKSIKFAFIVGLFVSSTAFAGADVTTDQLDELNVNYVQVSENQNVTLTVLRTEATAKVVDELALENVVDYAKSFEAAAKEAAFEERKQSRE